VRAALEASPAGPAPTTAQSITVSRGLPLVMCRSVGGPDSRRQEPWFHPCSWMSRAGSSSTIRSRSVRTTPS
jgi:hypothetical protein